MLDSVSAKPTLEWSRTVAAVMMMVAKIIGAMRLLVIGLRNGIVACVNSNRRQCVER